MNIGSCGGLYRQGRSPDSRRGRSLLSRHYAMGKPRGHCFIGRYAAY